MEHTGLLFLFTCQPTKSSNFSRSGVNVRAHLLCKNYSRNFSLIRNAPVLQNAFLSTFINLLFFIQIFVLPLFKWLYCINYSHVLFVLWSLLTRCKLNIFIKVRYFHN